MKKLLTYFILSIVFFLALPTFFNNQINILNAENSKLEKQLVKENVKNENLISKYQTLSTNLVMDFALNELDMVVDKQVKENTYIEYPEEKRTYFKGFSQELHALTKE